MAKKLKFRVTPPRGKTFNAQIVDGRVISDRNGEWDDETRLTAADLLMPEQNFIEWDIERTSK